MRDSIKRRDFLKRAGTAGLGLGLASQFSSLANAAASATKPLRRAVGPNDKLNVAVIGTNGRGLAHVECLTHIPGVQVAYICDVDDRAIATGIRPPPSGRRRSRRGLRTSGRRWRINRWTR